MASTFTYSLPSTTYTPQGTKISNAQFGTSEPATIKNLVSGDIVTCQFRPASYKFTRANNYSQDRAIGEDMRDTVFQGGNPFEMTLNLVFDSYEEMNASLRDVRKTTKLLWAMTFIAPQNKEAETNKGEPPLVEFRWGTLWTFKAVITSMSEEFTLFDPDGTPVRSKVEVHLRQAEQPGHYPGQNPTSGGHNGYAVHRIIQGETIDQIAFAEYGDSNAWRHLAASNRLDDPARLRAGQNLILIPLES